MTAEVLPARFKSANPARLLIGATWRRKMLATLLRYTDLGSLVLAFGAAALLAAHSARSTSLAEFAAIRFTLANCLIFLGLMAFWRLAFSLFSVHNVRRPLLVVDRIPEVVKAVGFGAVVLGVCAIALDIEIVSPKFLLVFSCLGVSLPLLSRLALKVGLRLFESIPEIRRNVLILGTGPRALGFAQACEEDSESGFRLLGFVDDGWAGTDAFRQSGLNLAADPKNLGDYLDSNIVDELIVALPLEALESCRRHVFSVCHDFGVNVRVLSSVLTDADYGEGSSFDPRDDVAITIINGRLDGWPLLAKRAFDILGSLALLAALSPILLTIAVLIKCSSAGPALFSQERVGLNSRRFRVLKFRTMVADAERRLAELEDRNEVDGPIFKIFHDPRITPLGRILRTSSLDELPQLINVLKGEMSLVGPRPLPLRDVELFGVEHSRRRFSVRPGITGLWQVSGRSTLPFEMCMKYDLQYVDEWSLGLDLGILARTLPAVIRRTGSA